MSIYASKDRGVLGRGVGLGKRNHFLARFKNVAKRIRKRESERERSHTCALFPKFSRFSLFSRENIINFQRVFGWPEGWHVQAWQADDDDDEGTLSLASLKVVVIFFLREICNFCKFRKPKWNICRSGTHYIWHSTDYRHSSYNGMECVERGFEGFPRFASGCEWRQMNANFLFKHYCINGIELSICLSADSWTRHTP